MRLLALRAETMQAMRRLKLPCDDITPIGLWGSDMFLIGVNNDQFEVLRLWNVQTEDVTPATLRDLHTESSAIPTSPSAGNAASGARSSATGAPTAAPLSTSSVSGHSVPARPERTASMMPASDPAPASSSRPLAVDRIERMPESVMPNPALAQGRSALDIQPAFASAATSAAVAQAPAPEASGVRSSLPGSTADLQLANGSAASPSAAPAPGVGSRRDGGPDLKLESNTGTAHGSRSDVRSPKSSRSDAEARPAPRESGRDSAKVGTKDIAKDGGSNAGKLRMTVDGEHLYAEIKGGKIVLNDRTYDSLAHARDSIRRERNKVAVWEYFDEGVKAWRVLNRD
jgi:hypothetical protein